MDPSKANTGELIQIEELLAIANESAKKAISVRRRLKRDGLARHEVDALRSRSEAREFVDAAEVKWIAIAVRPSTSKSLTPPYQSGWLSFDNGAETRRFAPIPANWTQASEEELRTLCQMAKVATRRTKG